MSKEILSLLDSLNDYMHLLEHSKEEIRIWREFYIDEYLKGKSEYEINVFLSLPSSYFKDKSPNEVFEKICKVNEK